MFHIGKAQFSGGDMEALQSVLKGLSESTNMPINKTSNGHMLNSSFEFGPDLVTGKRLPVINEFDPAVTKIGLKRFLAGYVGAEEVVVVRHFNFSYVKKKMPSPFETPAEVNSHFLDYLEVLGLSRIRRIQFVNVEQGAYSIEPMRDVSHMIRPPAGPTSAPADVPDDL